MKGTVLPPLMVCNKHSPSDKSAASRLVLQAGILCRPVISTANCQFVPPDWTGFDDLNCDFGHNKLFFGKQSRDS
jgi:hypothetical protein